MSNAPRNAPSLSPPRSSCRIWLAVAWTSAEEEGERAAGAREARSKFAGDSGSRASMLMVRQLVERAMVGGVVVVVVVDGRRGELRGGGGLRWEEEEEEEDGAGGWDGGREGI